MHIACVCVGTAFSPEYVHNLHAMVRRNLAAGTRGTFTVLTDNPAAFAGTETRVIEAPASWWAKLWLFQPGAFPEGERVLYFDLDTVITGPIDDLLTYRGDFAILQDFYRRGGLQSSVMAWEAGKFDYLYTDWIAAGRPELPGGDQEWLEQKLPAVDRWQMLYPKKFVSFKVHAWDEVPEHASVVVFHGYPRPHEAGGWVPSVWNDNAAGMVCNTTLAERKRNVAHALLNSERWLQMRDGLQSNAIIVGGGPSLSDDLWRIRGYQLSGAAIFATNGAYAYLKEHGIQADGHVIVDGRLENLQFVPHDKSVICYYASQTHPEVRKAAGSRLVCWHRYNENMKALIGSHSSGDINIRGGSTAGILGLSIAYVLGYRNFLLFGFDSSYADDHHAYSQALNDGEPTSVMAVGDREFRAAPWMVRQVDEFQAVAEHMTAIGCKITVFGDGLLPTVARMASTEPRDPDRRAREILKRLEGVKNPVGAEIGVFVGDLSKRLLARPDLTLYMVDSWDVGSEGYAASGDFHASLSKNEQEAYYTEAKTITYFARDRAKIVRKDSVEAAKDIPDGSLDFVFIDADHSYEGCRRDILAWLPKVKRGGLISGHDYANTEFPDFGVQRAVDEMFTPTQLSLGENFTWFVRRD